MAELDWPPVWSSPCSPQQRSAPGYSPGPPLPVLHLGAWAGHASAGMSRKDLKDMGESLDAGTAGLVVVGVSDMEAKIEQAMAKAEKIEKKQIEADVAEANKDANED